MKHVLYHIAILLISTQAFCQLNIKKQFKIAFQNSYDNYTLHASYKKSKMYSKVYIEGVDKITHRKVFDYEATEELIKDGPFNFYPAGDENRFCISFEKGEVTRLSITLANGTWIIYTIKNDHLNGMHISYHPGGHMKEYGFYKDDARIGHWLFCNVYGKVIAEGDYCGENKQLFLSPDLKLPVDFPCKTGTWKFYDDNGTLTKEITYPNK